LFAMQKQVLLATLAVIVNYWTAKE
jgi:hypothetical protein